MKIIIPCAGRSARFPGVRPKWMLTHPDGSLMVKKAIDEIDIEPKDIIITILKKHEEEYQVKRGLRENIGEDIQIVVLDEQTKSQPETVYLTLNTKKRVEIVRITDQVEKAIQESKVKEGMVLVNPMHVTAAVVVNDNESGLHQDYLRILEKLVPYGDDYRHNDTGDVMATVRP